MRKRSSKFLGVFGFRTRKCVERRNRAKKNFEQRDAICVNFLAVSFPREPFLQNPSLDRSFFCLLSLSFRKKNKFVFSFLFIKPFRDNILVCFFCFILLSCSCSYLSSFWLLFCKHISLTSPFETQVSFILGLLAFLLLMS